MNVMRRNDASRKDKCRVPKAIHPNVLVIIVTLPGHTDNATIKQFDIGEPLLKRKHHVRKVWRNKVDMLPAGW